MKHLNREQLRKVKGVTSELALSWRAGPIRRST
jgi:hypothetical protein